MSYQFLCVLKGLWQFMDFALESDIGLLQGA